MKMKAGIAAMVLFGAMSTTLQVQADSPWMWGGRDAGNFGCDMMGPGMMMGDGMMGPGMMMGSGMGFGGMGYGGMGMGAMMGGYGMLGLSDKQIAQMNEIQTRLQKKHWEMMGKMIDEQAGLRQVWGADKPDPKKVGAAFARVSELRRQAIEERVEAMNKMYDLLTDEQRERMRSGPWGMWGQGAGPMDRGRHMMMR